MSKYSSIDTCFDDQDALVEALKADGFQPLLATDQVAGDPLTGYQGDKRKDRAHVIIPRQQIGGASNDIGFRRGTDGTFTHLLQFATQSGGNLLIPHKAMPPAAKS